MVFRLSEMNSGHSRTLYIQLKMWDCWLETQNFFNDFNIGNVIIFNVLSSLYLGGGTQFFWNIYIAFQVIRTSNFKVWTWKRELRTKILKYTSFWMVYWSLGGGGVETQESRWGGGHFNFINIFCTIELGGGGACNPPCLWRCFRSMGEPGPLGVKATPIFQGGIFSPPPLAWLGSELIPLPPL